MNSTTRYILTSTAVVVGLFTVGATANALNGNGNSGSSPIGDPVVVPSSASLAGDDSSPEVVHGPGADDLDEIQTQRRTRGQSDGEGTGEGEHGSEGEHDGEGWTEPSPSPTPEDEADDDFEDDPEDD